MESKHLFESDFFRLYLLKNKYIIHDENIKYDYQIIFAPTKNFIHPPVSNSELRGLADFIYKYLENN